MSCNTSTKRRKRSQCRTYSKKIAERRRKSSLEARLRLPDTMSDDEGQISSASKLPTFNGTRECDYCLWRTRLEASCISKYIWTVTEYGSTSDNNTDKSTRPATPSEKQGNDNDDDNLRRKRQNVVHIVVNALGDGPLRVEMPEIRNPVGMLKTSRQPVCLESDCVTHCGTTQIVAHDV